MIDQAKARLEQGDVVAIPTETVYGLAGDVTNPKAIEKIFKLKERPFFDPLIVHISDFDDVLKVANEFPPLARKIAQKFWPGPLTIVLPKRDDLTPMITSGLETVGVRIPDHPLTRELIRQLGRPLAAPSANKFGRTSPTSPEHVRQEFGDQVLVLDGGICTVGVESTVIGFNIDFSEIQIYRPGAVTKVMLEAFGPTKNMPSIMSPGHLKHHYMPKIPLIILTKAISLNDYQAISNSLNLAPLYPAWVELPTEPTLAARTLYHSLRQAAERPGKNVIFLQHDLLSSQNDLWSAINDRLQRAAAMIVSIS